MHWCAIRDYLKLLLKELPERAVFVFTDGSADLVRDIAGAGAYLAGPSRQDPDKWTGVHVGEPVTWRRTNNAA